MAILTLAAPISGIRGKVGGIVYSANKSGPYAKAWGRGSNPRTEKQTGHRNNLVQFSQAWATLTAGQKSAWDTYAALPAQDLINSLGDTYSASGFNWFVTLNLARKQFGQTQLSDGPVLGTPATPIITNLRLFTDASPSNTRILLSNVSPGLTQQQVVHGFMVNSAGRIQQAELNPFIKIQIPAASRTVTIQAETEQIFGTIQIGQKLFVAIAIQNDEGRRGSVATASHKATS